jgi:sec-independent protein translocase protein TatB
MFDFGFTELMLIGLIALVVIGPEKLPRVARTVGHLTGRLQRYVADVKTDISREMELEDLRKMRDSVQQAASELEATVQGEISKTESEIAKTGAELEQTLHSLDKPAETRPEEGRAE